MSDKCLTTLPYTARFVKTTWLLGCVLSSTCYGLLVLLGCLSLRTLWRRETTNFHVKRGLIGYVSLTILIGTAAQVWGIKGTVDGVLDDTCNSNFLQPPNPYTGRIDIMFLIINLLTDGLLVWRCYAIANGLRGKAWSLLWFIPSIVYVGMLVTGILLVTRALSIANGQEKFGQIPAVPIQFGISLFLNTLITSSIVTLVLQHRRQLSRTFGKVQGHSKLYPNLLTLLVESGGLVLLVDVFAIITFLIFSPIANIAFHLWVHTQPIASLLIIYRVSRGADYFSRGDGESKFPVETLRFAVVSSPPSHPVEDMTNKRNNKSFETEASTTPGV